MKTQLFISLAFASLAALPLCAQNTEENKPKDRLNFEKTIIGESTGYEKRDQRDIDEEAKRAGKKLHQKVWTCIIDNPKTAMTMVKLESITSISKQAYMLEGAQKIQEVTIDTTGNNSIRFYCMSSERINRAASRVSNARGLVDKYAEGATQNAIQLPSKKYPEGTCSHNVEFQVASAEQLHAIYESVTHAWVSGQAATLRLKP